MASDGPDPQSLKSWQDVFQYPIPTVRRVEQELRRDIASNKEKLRSLVGTRYRELVGTAETIVSMNHEMREVDSTLSDIGRRCNPRLMEKKYTHYNQIKGDVDDEDAAKRTLGAQLALLHRCATSISRLLRRRGSLFLVAKLMVVSRRLHKTLSEQNTVPPFLESLRNQLASLRRTLLRRTEKRLASSTSTADDIIEALAAYCLATSSSSDDAIRYFHKVRLDVIGSALEQDKYTKDNIPNALKLYIRTLQTTKILLSRRLADVLNKLKLRPLLADPEIRSLDDLGLDVLGRWVAPDVSNFTPWIKLSELSKTDVDRTIKQWSKQAFDRFAEGAQKYLGSWLDFSSLLSLRAETLELWLSSWSATRTHSSLQVLEGLRTLFNERLKEILAEQGRSLELFGQDVAVLVSKWDDKKHATSRSLWDDELLSLDYSNGASTFKKAIADRLLGRNEDVFGALDKYEAWLSGIERSRMAIEELRQTRWTDVLEEGDDEELDLDIPALLNEDDTGLLEKALQLAVREAYDSLQIGFSDIFKAFGGSAQNEKASFVLRLIRLVRRDLPTEFIAENFLFSKDIVPQLQEVLATEVATHTLKPGFLVKSNSKKSQRVPGRTLWEGDIAVPVQPSPETFKFLRRLVSYMDLQGPGLWDASTIQVLKQSLQQELAQSLTSAVEILVSHSSVDQKKTTDTADEEPQVSERPSPEVNGHDDQQPGHVKSPLEQTIRDRKFQLCFDALYLKNALFVQDGDDHQFKSAMEKVRSSLESEDEENSIKRMEQQAKEYWTRTRMVFGLLSE
ncbi:hypothetical protein FE257_004154 [Aspergillus nanangensis]|uniref:Conserved oligomeric Golgi complex subunit 1 n=1 Tax=Aspergillus nanangensis TaxID=2582783 RepID=A0AAD4GV40_ASPNN|nr:hypothetical protein FE257_004154 [Aspergillus nanangensis]